MSFVLIDIKGLVMIELWVVVVIGVGVCLFWWLKSSDDTNPLDKYQAEHISDFVAFAKTQRHLPKSGGYQTNSYAV